MTFARLRLALRRVRRRMWFRATIYCGFGVAAALLGALVQRWIPDEVAGLIGADSVGNLLSILAASMLAVTTFSLSTMVSAYSSAATGATPRATRLLIADSSAQGALATFIGAFLFSVVGLIALSTGLYGDSGRVVLFAATIGMIVLITVTLLAWIEQLSGFGRINTTINLVEKVTRGAVQAHAADPLLGGVPGTGGRPAQSIEVEAHRIGYIEHVDMARLSNLAESRGLEIHLAQRPGGFVAPGRPLAWVVADESGEEAPGEDVLAGVRAAFIVAGERSFEQDPRFGFVVLTEIGSRALSAAINDPGTAIDVIGTVTRLLCEWARLSREAEPEVRYPRLSVLPVAVADVFDDVFPPLARDGAQLLEVGIRLQKTLATLAATGHADFAAAAAVHAEEALARGLQAMSFQVDRERLRAAALAPRVPVPPAA